MQGELSAAHVWIAIGIAVLVCLALWKVARANNPKAYLGIGIVAVLLGCARLVLLVLGYGR